MPSQMPMPQPAAMPMPAPVGQPMFGAMPQPGQPMPVAMPQPGQPMFGALPSPSVPAPVQGAPLPVPVANQMNANNYKAFVPSQAPATEGA